MKTVLDKLINENIPIEQCQEGEKIYIRQGTCSSGTYGNKILVKIKLLPKRKVQIKYKGTYSDSTIQKGIMSLGTTVERTRKATRADAPDAGFYPPKTTVIDGIEYSMGPSVEILDPLPAGSSINMKEVRSKEDPISSGGDYGDYVTTLASALMSSVHIRGIVGRGGLL